MPRLEIIIIFKYVYIEVDFVRFKGKSRDIAFNVKFLIKFKRCEIIINAETEGKLGRVTTNTTAVHHLLPLLQSSKHCY